MADESKGMQREVRELHEKARQDAMRKLKGEELDEALKKLDELFLPLERISSYSQAGTRLTKDQILAFVLFFALTIVYFVFAGSRYDSVLFFQERIHWTAFFLLLPLVVSGIFYAVSVRLLKAKSRGIESSIMKYNPMFRYPIMFLFSAIAGAGSIFMFFYLPVSVGMDFMSSEQVKFDSTVVEIKNHSFAGSRYDFHLLVQGGGQEIGHLPKEVTLVLPMSDIEGTLKQGDKALIVGREGFGGIIVDRVIKSPANQDAERLQGAGSPPTG